MPSTVDVKEVSSKKEQRPFVSFPNKLYKDCPHYVPAFYSDEMKLFSKDYFYYEDSEAVYYLAYKNGKVVGRISAILQHASNKKWNQKRVRFTRFDSIDDFEVAKALFEKVESWAKEKKMNEVVGPLGFSDMEKEGMLVEGFDELSTFCEMYNYPYYPKFLEKLGYTKEVDWLERELRAPKVVDPRIEEISNRMMKKAELHFAKCRNGKEIMDKYGEQFFDIVDDTYKDIYMSVPFTKKERENMMKSFSLVLSPKNLAIILNKDNKCVAFGLCFPSLSRALLKSGGHYYPWTLFKLLRAIKHPKYIDMCPIGVRDEYKNCGIDWAILSYTMKMLSSGVYYAETNLNLEDNLAINNTWAKFDNRIHKRRRSYVKKIV
ncbi:MAG: hypothetical protein LKE31_02010 [Bacilli bacterium]|jgi:hypothetical protein|nr:hypothetical protein [Bacilli bacterium]